MSLTGLLQPLRAPVSRQVSRLLAAIDGPPGGLKSGPRTPGLRREPGPVVLVLLFGAEPATVAASAQRLATVAARGPATPLLVLDRPELAAVRRAGLAVEHLVDRRTWEGRGEPQPWPEYLRVRLEQLRQDYSTRLCLVLPPGGTDAVPDDVLEAGLLAPAATGTTALRQRFGRQLERWFDPPDQPA